MTDIISFTAARAARRDITLEDRVRARRARQAAVDADTARRNATAARARLVLVDLQREPFDPTSGA